MFGPTYFGASYFGSSYFGEGFSSVLVASPYFGPAYFGSTYFGPSYFGTTVGETPTPTPTPTPLPSISLVPRTPCVRIYSLDTMSLVDTVNLAHLRYARVNQVYALPLRLTTSYPVGRYGVLYQAPVDSFVGVSLSLFEVVAGGDAAGPVIASHTVTESTGDLVLGQLGSGAVVVGQKPGVM